MECRAPSSLVAVDGMLRRRSSVHPQQREDEEHEPETSFESAGYLHRKPTVILVRRAPGSPPLPFSSRSASPPPFARALPPADAYEPEALFSPVQLTPRPDGPHRADSDASFYSTGTLPPRLPTPDFTQHAHFLSFVPRGLSFLSQAPRPSLSLSRASAPQSRPQNVRAAWSSGSGSSASSNGSVDSGHRTLIKSIGTTDKFTHKWPRPRSLRNPEARGPTGSGLGIAALGALEDGRGLGMETVERWTGFKWCLLLSVCTVFAYGVTGLVCALMTWFRTWDQADVMYVADNDVLILITLAASILVFTSLVGMSGALLNSRPILAVYTLLLWPALVSIVAIGYVSYKRTTFSLDHKLNLSWSQYYTPLGRLLIQDSLRCCGFYSALHEATPSKRCYPRTSLPGCKGKLYRFERANLALVWSTVFSLVPLHLLNVLAALLCANHVTARFGKGITPKGYRLTSLDVKVDAEKILMGMKELDVRPVERPPLSRASSSGVFREDREDRVPFLAYEGHQY